MQTPALTPTPTMQFTQMLLLAACTVFPLVAGNSFEPTGSYAAEKRDTAIRDLLVQRNYCRGGFFCVDDNHCCPNGWGCCAGLLFL